MGFEPATSNQNDTLNTWNHFMLYNHDLKIEILVSRTRKALTIFPINPKCNQLRVLNSNQATPFDIHFMLLISRAFNCNKKFLYEFPWNNIFFCFSYWNSLNCNVEFQKFTIKNSSHNCIDGQHASTIKYN